MIKRAILFSLGCGLMFLLAGGCCGLGRGLLCGSPCDPCGGGPACGPCGSDCGGGCGTCGSCGGPIRGRIAARMAYADCGDCETGCGSCGPCGGGACGSCDPCGGGLCGPYGPCYGFRPLRWIAGLFCGPKWCGSGCGEMYCGEFCNDRPDCWDPCDEQGNWTGRGGCATCAHRSGNGGYQTAARSQAYANRVSPDDVADPPVRVSQSQRPQRAVRPADRPPAKVAAKPIRKPQRTEPVEEE
jgi:hypothetical protein